MLTVFFATYNRAHMLGRVLEAFAGLQAVPGGWKLVVADNASTDCTRQVLRSFESRLPLTYIHEPRQGKNTALNSALAHLEGDLAVFTDDDVFPHPDWLVQMRRAADENPEYTMIGGAIVPRWECPPPHWVEWVADKGPVFALSSPDLAEGPSSYGSIFGPNMAVRAEIFYKGMRFDPSIGPCGTNYPMGSEAELLGRLGRQGYKAWHSQRAVVEHFIRKEQLTKEWIFGRYVRIGRGEYRLHRNAQPETLPSFGMYVLKMVKQTLLSVKADLSAGEKERFRARCEVYYFRGHALEAQIMSRESELMPTSR